MNRSYKQYKDEEIWSMFIEKDKHAFAWLYEKYKKNMYGFFYSRLYQDKELAKDATQNLFLKIIEKKQTYNSKYPFKSWLFTIANNMCKNYYRKKANEKNYATAILEEAYHENDIDNIHFERTFRKALQSLKEEPRAIFLLRYQSHLSIKEIANIVKTPEGTVKSSLFYSIKKLSKVLIGYQHVNFKKVSLWKD